jgi:uncharacterized protein YbjT (DUF2867 family)
MWTWFIILSIVAAFSNWSPASADHFIEIGGQDVLRYAEMMTRYARVRGLKRLLIAVPVLTPRLSSY